MRGIPNSIACAAVVALVATGCGSDSSDEDTRSSSDGAVPVIAEVGTRSNEYHDLGDLADIASALVLAVPTGQKSSAPLPFDQGGNAESAPTQYVQMRVITLLSGDLQGELIEVVSPGDDVQTGLSALLSGGSFLMYLTPAMYAADRPAGGYAIAGGPAGVYANTGVKNVYEQIDTLSTDLPEEINVTTEDLPEVSHSDEELLEIGPS